MAITPEELAVLHRLCQDLAVEAAAMVQQRAVGGVTVAAIKSSAVDIVTAVDREVEHWLKDRLARERPDDAVLGEEDGETPGTSGLTWVVDPIDGLVNYLYGLPFHAVSVAVCAGEPDPRTWDLLAGAVSAPVLGHTWHAFKGGGAWRDDVRLGVPEKRPLSQCLLATGFSYVAEERAEQGRVLSAVLPHVRDVRRFGSASIDLCLVAEGRIDVYYERGPHPWDHAAGELVVRESGGDVIGLRGERASRAMVVAGHGGLAAEVAALLESVGV